MYIKNTTHTNAIVRGASRDKKTLRRCVLSFNFVAAVAADNALLWNLCVWEKCYMKDGICANNTKWYWYWLRRKTPIQIVLCMKSPERVRDRNIESLFVIFQLEYRNIKRNGIWFGWERERYMVWIEWGRRAWMGGGEIGVYIWHGSATID